MHISTRQEYAGAPETVFSMLTNEAFLSEVAKRTGATEYSVEADSNKTKLRAGIPSPSQVRKFVGEVLTIELSAEWTELVAGRAQATLKGEVERMPASYDGHVSLYSQGDKTIVNYEADFDIHIPLIGSRLEKAAAPNAQRVVELFQEVGNEWLAD